MTAYFNWGLTRELEAASQSKGILVFILCRINPSLLLLPLSAGPSLEHYRIELSICISSYTVHMGIPGETTGDINPEIPGTWNRLQNLSIQLSQSVLQSS